MKKISLRVCIAVFAAILLFAGSTIALADHTGVNGGSITVNKATYDANGNITSYSQAGPTDAYSPKATCAGCHISNCGTGANGWCKSDAERTAYQTANPTTAWPDYGVGTAYSTHVQGVLDSGNNLSWQADQVKSFANGVSTSYHMNQGRNENYSNVSRTTYNDPFFTSSPGMYGKY